MNPLIPQLSLIVPKYDLKHVACTLCPLGLAELLATDIE